MPENDTSSQRPNSFHPDFDCEVFMVVFSVEGQGFKIDSTRLTMHSDFLRNMLSTDAAGSIGLPAEGTTERPIIVHGCTKETFANFLGWLNHSAWNPLVDVHLKQVLDILHVSHMWDIKPGIDFSIRSLSEFPLRPAHRFFLSHRYNILAWIPGVIRSLLATPLESFTSADIEHMGTDIYVIISVAKEKIGIVRRRIAITPPYPSNVNDAPYCVDPNTCKKLWADKWYASILRKIHHSTSPIPISHVIDTVKDLEHRGMHADCKDFVLEWLRNSQAQVFQGEEDLIEETIRIICRIYGVPE